MVTKKGSSEHLGFGFVQFAAVEDANLTIELKNGSTIRELQRQSYLADFLMLTCQKMFTIVLESVVLSVLLLTLSPKRSLSIMGCALHETFSGYLEQKGNLMQQI
ncbi:hypothetical protein ACH5RR_002369 [Cinchona calisaya]|uniref:RRM domain-containing protein n=1 Tax=Cinchona calisaya TaxID=153742 RepID=A0ABD3B620_9GENT